MNRIGLAFRAFFGLLTGSIPVDRMQALLSDEVAPSSTATPPPREVAPEPGPDPVRARSDAITLLATLQREARFVDLVQEPLGDYTDPQIGAAARDVLRDCREVLSRMFALQPVVAAAENDWVETPPSAGAGRFRVTGDAVGELPARGKLVHHGWEATRCNLPAWSGDEQAARVVAPAEIECA